MHYEAIGHEVIELSDGRKMFIQLSQIKLRTKRNHQLKIRMNDDEFNAAKEAANAAGLSMAEVIRMSVGRVRAWTLEDREGLRLVSKELAKLGNNLNQIARHANTNSVVDLQVLAALEAIQTQLNEVKKCTSNS
ncbi:MAG: plasmid mobilization relaxosome protein MobC [Gallionellaceae bacterium]